MAQKVQVTLVDDLDGSAAEETVSFALDGVGYEIDLSARNAKKLRDAFALYVGSARKAGRRSRSVARQRRSAGGRTADIRAWARANRIAVNDRGRIAADVIAKYEAANK